MPKRNFAAWHIDASAYETDWPAHRKLEFFARYAVLAPSGHNTQPWDLTLSEETMQIRVNQAHFLPIDGSGLQSVEPFISIGTFIEAFVLAAQGYGCGVDVNYPDSGDVVAELSLSGAKEPRQSLVAAIETRVSNRNPFAVDSLSQELLDGLTLTDLPGVEAKAISLREDINFVADQTAEALRTIMSNPSYRGELSKWVRTNHTLKYDGMPGNTHGFNGLQALVSKLAVRYAPNQGPGAEKSKKLILGSGALIVVSCKDEQRVSFVNAGRLYTNICVRANEAGIASSALGASVLDATTRERMKERFGLVYRPVYLLRLGKATMDAPHSPRWPLKKLLRRTT